MAQQDLQYTDTLREGTDKIQANFDELYAGSGGGAVSSVYGRTGAVVAASGDYTGSQITNTPAGNIAATTVQAAINELDSEKQASLGFTPENVAGKDATGGYAGLTLFKINFKNALNTFTSFFTNSNTAARTYTFQDRNGIIADDTDITSAKDRANQTGTQLASTISDFNTSVDTRIVNTKKAVTQASHGLIVGDVIRYNGTTWVKAQADAIANAGATGYVIVVTDTNNFTRATGGTVDITGLGLTANTEYFLSSTTAGVLTSTAPTTTGQVRKSILKTNSTTEADLIFGESFELADAVTTNGHVIKDAGTTKTQRTNLNFIGFTVADNSGTNSTDITAPSGGSAVGILAPVADLTALKAIDTTSAVTYPDRYIITVETLGIYRLDRDSSATGDDNLVVTPTAGVGRWFKETRRISETALTTAKNKQVLYNTSGNIDSEAGFEYDPATNELSVDAAASTSIYEFSQVAASNSNGWKITPSVAVAAKRFTDTKRYDYIDTTNLKIVQEATLRREQGTAIDEITGGNQSSTSATAVVLETIAVASGQLVSIESVIDAIVSGGATTASHKLSSTYKNVAGTVTLVGTALTTYSRAGGSYDGLTTGLPSYNISGTNIELRFAGAAAVTANVSSRTTTKYIS